MTQKNNNYKSYNSNIFVTIIRIILIIVLLPIVLIYLIIKLVKGYRLKRENKEKVKIFSISQIDTLTGTEFEEYLKLLFETMGYEVFLTKASGDFGADLILKKKNENIIVQAKCFSKTVGVRAVQEIIAAKNHYRVQDAVVVTNNYFSKEAQTLAIESDVRLVDRDILVKIIQKNPVYFERKKIEFVATTLDAQTQINARYKFWI